MFAPEQLFVVSQISRKQIAENLNGVLLNYDSKDTSLHIKEDDPLLTDEFCTKYAADYGDLCSGYDDTDSDEFNEADFDFNRDKLITLGYDPAWLEESDEGE